jgi:Xaa-Pro aminopeptidase
MTVPGPPDWTGRLAHLREYVRTHELDAFVVSTSLNIAYLTGFHGSSGLLVVTRSDNFLIVDGRYVLAAQEALSSGTIGPVRVERVESRYDRTLAAVLAREGHRRAGFEAGQVTVATLDLWRRAAPEVDWIPTQRVVEHRRMIKDAGEIVTFRRAGHAIARVAAELPAIVARGRSEREIASSIEHAMVTHGFQRPAFATIVASGPNSALPHARPGDRRLEDGDLVVLDFGGVLDGYCVDLTRMAAVGPISTQAMALYDSVRAANIAAVQAVRPGVDTSDVDLAARTVLEARNLGDAFNHAAGHGLGMEVHEAPRIAKPDPDVRQHIEIGMVLAIEPGAYVEGVGGVRLEDDVLVTADGCEVLTEVPHDLLRV